MTSPRPDLDPGDGGRRGGRALWLAAAACAATGAVLLTPALPGGGGTDPTRPAASSASPVAAATAASGATSTTGLPASGSRPPATTAAGGRPAMPHDDEPVPPAVPPLPADQVHGHSDADVDPADQKQWRPVLTGFASDFTRAGTGTADWAGRLRRWTTPQLAASYTRVAPHEIPTGALVEVLPADVGAFTLTFTARYDTGLVLRGQAAFGPTSWRVTTVEPDRPADPA